MKLLSRLFTEYSLENGTCRIEESVKKAKELGYTHIAITDENTLAASLKLQRACDKFEIKQVIGATLKLETKDYTGEITAYCRNLDGFNNLKKLITLAHKEGNAGKYPSITLEHIDKNKEGIVFAIGNFNSSILHSYQNQDKKEFKTHIEELHKTLGQDLRFAITNYGEKSGVNKALAFIAERTGIQCIISHETYFLNQEDHEAHKARYCISQGETFDSVKDYTYDESFFMQPAESTDEIEEKYKHIIDSQFPEAVEGVSIETGKLHLPKIESDSSPIEELRTRAYSGLKAQIKDHDAPEYTERMETELGIIEQLGFEDYYIIVSDILLDAKRLNIAIGPGRGSGPGSLIAYCVRITELDPIKHKLLFERFLNPDRVSPPDFDIDVCQEDRGKLIKLIREKYGEEKVSQIGTRGTFGARQAIEDAGKVLGIASDIILRLKKSIPNELEITIRGAYKASPQFQEIYHATPGAALAVKLATKLEGLTRNVSKHAGGILISPTCLTDFTSLYYDKKSPHPASQLDMKDIEDAGLVKFDFLGLRTLTVIKHTLKHVNKRRYMQGLPTLLPENIPLEDELTFRMLKKTLSSAVFQLESAGMKQLIEQLQPDSFEDVVALVALFRPGPLGAKMHIAYAERKHGREEPNYYHPDLEPILKDTYGVILYQEQVMQIAQKMGGYTLGEADLLRRAMGKKKPEEMAKQESIFLDGAKKLGYDEAITKEVFFLMAKFADYGFNKSHSAAYAVLSCQTAYLKAHYPAELLSATLTSISDDSDKLLKLIADAKVMGLEVLPPSINDSSFEFTPETPKAIRYSLAGIKKIGRGPAKALYNERVLGGSFKSFNDLIQRTNPRAMNAGAQRALAKSGALDELFKEGREQALLTTGCVKEKSEIKEQLSAFEFEAFGMFFYENPVAALRDKFQYTLKTSEIKPNNNYQVRGVVTDLKHLLTKAKKNMTVFTLVDEFGAIPCLAFNETSSRLKTIIENGELYYLEAKAGTDNQNGETNLIINGVINGT